MMKNTVFNYDKKEIIGLVNVNLTYFCIINYQV